MARRWWRSNRSTWRPDRAVTPGGGDQLQQALGYACAYINRRERTVAEVRAQLERKGIPDALIEPCLEELSLQGLVDDARFARLFVSDKRELEQWGAERIRRGLLARGVARELAESALLTSSERSGDEEPTELDRAVELLRRRFPQPPRERRERDRALGVLLRKGYESELALDALSAYARAG
jgi:regulatory protein